MNPVDYALLAQRAYSDAPTIGQADSASRMHVYGDVHMFRGSDDIQSWLHDFDIALVDTPFGKLHAGIWHAWLDIREPCLALPPPSAIGGHSEGAGLAIFEAAEWAKLGHVVPVYAFEPPRICGDDVLAKMLAVWKVPFFATRNGNDLVTEIPTLMSLPGPLTRIGTPALSLPNLIDHSIDRVIAALSNP
ncbi:lipase family protein [Rhodanobacter hydrolyticus]|uniref:Lipase n=1 Tax=Rhodanobacter hydrolyticus TaxID=2250595 RepID=A0ABW8J3P0_9GAMM